MTTPASDTPDRLLDAAESLFADVGIDGTSLRQITTLADANLASIHYHFGSKEALLEAVFRRRVEPLNRERLETLEELEAGTPDGEPPELAAVLRAWLMPALRLGQDTSTGGSKFVRLMGRSYSEPGPYFADLMPQLFGEIFARFLAALARTLPELPRRELVWRMHFLLGSMIHTIADPARIETFSGGLCDPSDVEGVGRRLIAFVAAGMRAPLPPGCTEDDK